MEHVTRPCLSGFARGDFKHHSKDFFALANKESTQDATGLFAVAAGEDHPEMKTSRSKAYERYHVLLKPANRWREDILQEFQVGVLLAGGLY